MDLTEVTWRTSSYRCSTGCCVEVTITEDGVAVRDTKDRAKPPHVYSLDEWHAFIDGVKAGEFDLP